MYVQDIEPIKHRAHWTEKETFHGQQCGSKVVKTLIHLNTNCKETGTAEHTENLRAGSSQVQNVFADTVMYWIVVQGVKGTISNIKAAK